jgi:hypothetical protein
LIRSFAQRFCHRGVPDACPLIDGEREHDCAVLRGCDVDKPRNLAKSVTVE